MGFKLSRFKDIELSDHFFDTLKSDYKEFSEWFEKKAENVALIHFDDNGVLNGFLYLKEENEELDITPHQEPLKRLKVGTMKIDAHGTKLGERFIKKIFDKALASQVEEIYVTIFDKHEGLIALFKEYFFEKIGVKESKNGLEGVYSRKLKGNIIPDYPFIKYTDLTNIYFLSIYPMFHTRLFPDSILNNENKTIVQDISPTNSIHKIYIAGMQGMEALKTGDILMIYRTAPQGQSAYYHSVATSICCVEEYIHINKFKEKSQFIDYCKKHSIFSITELEKIYKERKYTHIIKMSYNIALTKRVNRAKLIELGIMSNDRTFYSGFGIMSIDQLKAVMCEGKTDEGIIIDQT